MTVKRFFILGAGVAVLAGIGAVGAANWSPRTTASAVQPTPIAAVAMAARQALPIENTATPASDRSADISKEPLPLLPAGLTIGDTPPAGWSHLVLHAVPRVAEGDVSSVSALVTRLAGLFHLTVLANVAEKAEPGAPAQFVLEKVAVGLSTPVGDSDVTVRSDEPAPAGAKLRFIEQTALAQNEASVKTAQRVARTETMLVFDAETIMLRDGQHRRTVHRHAVLVSPESGRLATLIWPLEPVGKQRYQVCSESLQRLPENFREDRTIHVDADCFVLGVPTKEAFALTRLPAGEPISLTPDLKALLAGSFADVSQVLRLESALRSAIDNSTAGVPISSVTRP